MTLVDVVLSRLSSVAKPQSKFEIILLTTLMCLRGKANFRNLSRYEILMKKLTPGGSGKTSTLSSSTVLVWPPLSPTVTRGWRRWMAASTTVDASA